MLSTMMSVPLNLSHFLERAGKLFGALTAEHTHRMGRLGLTA